MPDLIPLSKLNLTQEDCQKLIELLNSKTISSEEIIENFECSIATRLHRSHGVAVSSGSSGILLTLLGLKISPGDEVILPAFGSISAANSITQAGATPVFADVHPKSLNINGTSIEKLITLKTKAIIAIENFGIPMHMPEIERIAQKYEISLIEDSREALGSSLNETPCGSFGRASVISFSHNKLITTGEGGMILTNDGNLANQCRNLRSQGGLNYSKKLQKHEMPDFGFNNKLSYINAFIGQNQLLRLDEILKKRTSVAEYYIEQLRDNPELILPTVTQGTKIGWTTFIVRLSDFYSEKDRDLIIKGLQIHDIEAAPYYPPINSICFYDKYTKKQQYPVSESVSKRTIGLPMFNSLSKEKIKLICQTLELMIQRQNFNKEKNN